MLSDTRTQTEAAATELTEEDLDAAQASGGAGKPSIERKEMLPGLGITLQTDTGEIY